MSATMKEILATKQSGVVAIQPDATVLEAAVLMNAHRIGSLLVMEGDQPIGIFSERDVLRRVVVPRRDPGTTVVRDVMTADLVVCRPETSLDEARWVMKSRRIRHLPVVDLENRLAGLISIGDLNAYDAKDQEHTIYMLTEYIHGRV